MQNHSGILLRGQLRKTSAYTGLADGDEGVRVWEAQTGHLVHQVLSPADGGAGRFWVNALALSPDGRTLASASSYHPVVGDYNGDGTTDFAVFRPRNSTWYISGEPSVQYGLTNDIAVMEFVVEALEEKLGRKTRPKKGTA